MEAWSCSTCTFLNPPSQKSKCQMCLSPSPSSSSSPRWSCSACTFSNTYLVPSCEMCGKRPLSVALENFGPSGDASVGSIFFPLRRCSADAKSKVIRLDAEPAESSSVGRLFDKESSKMPNARAPTLKILSYNIWFREDMEVYKRMEAIGDLIAMHSPDVICFQEVTPKIYQIFQKAAWWNEYKCSHTTDMVFERPYFCLQMSKLPVKQFRWVPFSNSIMGREVSIAEIDMESSNLVVATTHLESPCPAPPKWDQMYTPERLAQANFAMKLFKDAQNVVFCGDMNWDEKRDGSFPISEGWVDAWSSLRPKDVGWTYDTGSNQMLSANRTLKSRPDRFLCRFTDFKICSIEMIGLEVIPGISYVKEKKVKGKLQKLVLPLLPSDHYGLLLTIQGL